jgi:antitoxin component YwqK of YwqJK toxin-antitoxin module
MDNIEGDYKKYFPNGNLELECVYKNDLRNGLCKEYYVTGSIKSEGIYKDGLRNGFYTEYYETGEVKLLLNYKNDLRNGLAISFYRTGKLKTHIKDYKNDLRNGLHTEYLENGKISSLNYCIEGKTIYGKFYTYDSMRVSFTEGYNPIVDIITKDDLKVLFKINLPIPDSLTNKSSSILKYGLKSKSLKDSFILNSNISNVVDLSHFKPYYGELKLDKKEEQIFHGYIWDNEKQIVHNSFEISL